MRGREGGGAMDERDEEGGGGGGETRWEGEKEKEVKLNGRE